ncbi:MAG: hypothetical protein ACRCWM_06455 [Sarcina sp.]
MEFYNLYDMIKKVMENDWEALEDLHKQFNPLLNKYAYFFNTDKNNLISEFDLILINIYKKDIKDDLKILKYIKTAFKNYRKFQELASSEIFEFQTLKSEQDDITDIFFEDLIKSFNEDTKHLLNLKFKSQYTNSEIAREYGVTRQYIHKKIKLSLNLLKELI